jgi:putative membrane protein
MTRLILRWAIIGVAVWLAIRFVPGIEAGASDWTTIAAIALILGLLNALVRPILKLLSCPLIFLTLGLFVLVLNALMFWLAGWLGQTLGLNFTVQNFWAAFLGGLVVSVVSAVLNLLVKDDRERSR